MATSGDSPLRVGLVGANPDYGWGSGAHRRVIERLPGFVLQGVCTTRRESAEKAAREFRAAHAFTDAADLARHPDIDIVAICVKAPHHHAIARAALEGGKHVYCEWPLALTVPEAEELAALAAARKLKAMIGLHLRGAPALRYASQLIAEGFVGKVQGVNLHVRVFGPMMRAMALRSGGTTLHSIYGGHLLDAVDHYFGGVADITARQAIHLPPFDETGAAIDRDAADHILFQGALGSGAIFSLDLAGASLAGLGSTWRIDGSEGVRVLETRDPTLPASESLVVRSGRTDEPLRPLPVPAAHDCAAIPAEPDRYFAYPGSDASREALSAIGALYAELGEAIRSDGPVTPDFTRAADIQRLLASLDDASADRPAFRQTHMSHRTGADA